MYLYINIYMWCDVMYCAVLSCTVITLLFVCLGKCVCVCLYILIQRPMRGRKYENVICFTFQPLKFWSTPSPLQGYSLIPRSDAKRGEDTKRWLAWYGLKSLPTDGAFAYPPVVVSYILLTYMFFTYNISLEQWQCPQSLGIGQKTSFL